MAEEKIRFQMRIDPETDRKIKGAMPLEQLHGHCIQDVKETNGGVTLEWAVRFQDRRDD